MRLAKKYQNWIIAGYIIALILLSIVSFNGDLAPNKKHWVGIRTDYIIHTLFFVPWMVLANLRWNQPNKWKIFCYLFGIGAIMAAGSEFVQLMIPKKTFNPIDLAANGVGIVLGAIVWILFASLDRAQKKS